MKQISESKNTVDGYSVKVIVDAHVDIKNLHLCQSVNEVVLLFLLAALLQILLDLFENSEDFRSLVLLLSFITNKRYNCQVGQMKEYFLRVKILEPLHKLDDQLVLLLGSRTNDCGFLFKNLRDGAIVGLYLFV